jgi:hypothetical protein
LQLLFHGGGGDSAAPPRSLWSGWTLEKSFLAFPSGTPSSPPASSRNSYPSGLRSSTTTRARPPAHLSVMRETPRCRTLTPLAQLCGWWSRKWLVLASSAALNLKSGPTLFSSDAKVVAVPPSGGRRSADRGRRLGKSWSRSRSPMLCYLFCW